MTDSPVFVFFNEYPVFPVIILTSDLLSFLPIIILIYISQVAPLHGNCRFILCTWAIGLGAVIAADLAMAMVDLENDTGFMAMSMFHPLLIALNSSYVKSTAMRVKLYKFDVTCATFSSSFEIVLSIERIISVIRPRQYHYSKTAWKTMIALAIALMACGYLIDEALHSEDEYLTLFANVALGIIELSVLVVGAIASSVCGIRYRSLYGISSLTERYQAKEAYEMSKAMIPDYVISFIIKGTTVTAIFLYVTFIKDGYLTGFVQMYIVMTHAFYIIFSTTNLLVIHPLLRKHTHRKLESLMNLKVKQEAKRESLKSDTETYFSMLSVSWNK
uniref:G protein-coupled receptor n=1 Tax=Pristionchus pacificus TaxID=54126 RepID=A0A8R1UDC8_PRIPA